MINKEYYSPMEDFLYILTIFGIPFLVFSIYLIMLVNSPKVNNKVLEAKDENSNTTTMQEQKEQSTNIHKQENQ